jgi:hypothetical protein
MDLTTGSPLPRRPSWLERQRRRRQSALLRLLDHSLGLRLLVAAAVASLALAAVNRYEQCRDQGFARGCVWRDAGGVVSVGNLEAFSIVTAGILFLLESGKRRQREHHEAMDVILASQQAGVRFAPARNDALELVSRAGLELDHWDLSGIDLDQLRIAGVRWHGVNLSGSSLRHADLRRADLGEANLCAADLSHADLRGADLRAADLRDADLSQADLRGARLEGARLDGAVLNGSRRDGAQGC